jgi:hypothetical protein
LKVQVLYIIFEEKKAKKSHKEVGINVFVTFPDPDPGGTKTCGFGSGSATLPEGAATDGAGEEGSAALPLWLHLLPHVLGRQLRQRVVTPACMDYKFFYDICNSQS